MKSKQLAAIPTLLTLALASLHQAHAAGGTWNSNNAGNWSDATKWSPAVVPGTDPGDVINLTYNLATASRTVTIDSVSVTVGDLNIADPASSYFGYTLAAAAGRALQLDGTGTNDATVDFRSGGGSTVTNAISAPMLLVDNAVFRSNTQMLARMSGAISGTGKAITLNNDTDGTVNDPVSSPGRFELTAANTYDGGTTIDDVRVIPITDTSLGATGSSVKVQPGGQVYLNSATVTDLNYAFEIEGDGWQEGGAYGALRVEKGGIITGSVELKADAAIGNNSTTAPGKISGGISGAFNLSKRGAYGIILSGANTYTGTTTVQAGTLQIGDGGTSGNLSGAAVINNGTLAFNRSDTVTVANAITGSGAFAHSGTGTLILTNANTYAGTTTIAATATLQVGDGGTSGSLGSGNVANSGILEFKRSDESSVAAIVAGAGQLKQSGSGTLRLGGANTYTGSTWVNSGTLTVTGSLHANSAVTVAPAATLSGSGTVGGTVTVGSGGSVSAGLLGDGTLTLGELILGAGTGDVATLNVTRNAVPGVLAIQSKLTPNGDAGSVTVNIQGQPPALGQSTLIDYDTLDGTGFPAFKLGTLPNRVSAELVDNTVNGSIDLNVSLVDFPVWSGALSSEWSTQVLGGAKNWVLNSNPATPTDFLSGDSVVFNDAAGNTTVDISGGDVTPATVVFANDAKSYMLTGANGIAGSVGLIKNGPGLLTVANTNSYTGPTTLNGGVLSTATLTDSGVAGPLGAGGAVAFGGGTLAYTGATGGSNRALSLGAAGGTVTVASAAATLTLGGVVEGAGALTKTGDGNLALTGANLHSGGSTVAAGTLEATVSTTQNALGTGPATIAAGASLRLHDTTTLGTTTIANPVTGSGLLNLEFAAGTTARNTYMTGVTDFTGTVQLTSTGPTGDKWNINGLVAPGATVAIQSGCQLYVNGSNTFAAISLSGQGNSENLGAIRLVGTLTAPLTLTGDATIGTAGGTLNGSISPASAGPKVLTLGTDFATQGGTLNGNLSDGPGTLALTVARGPVTLAGTNTYTGNTTVSGGTLILADTGGLTFVIGDNGINNRTTGAGAATLNGTFTINLSGAVAGSGFSWTLVDTVTKEFGDHFKVLDFTEAAGVWTKTVGTSVWKFREDTGALTVTTAGYASWAAANANGEAANVDTDKDGVTNGIEYFMGETGSGFTTLPGVANTGGVRTVTWQKGVSYTGTYGVDYVVETSADLSHWDLAPSGVADSPTAVTYTLPTGPSASFCRLKVIVP